jgi:hypothetical protein
MAEALGQKAAQPLEMPTMPGVKISPLSGLAKMLDEYTAGRQERTAREESKALGEKYQADTSSDFSGLLASLTPKAAVPEGAPTYMPNVDQRDVAENSRMVMQPERNEMGEIIQPGEAGAGNFGVTPGTPAIPATTGALTAEGFKTMKTPAGQQQYMAQLLAQIKPKEAKWEVKEIKTEDGGVKTVLMNMNAANPLSTAVEAGKQGPKATYEDVGGKKVAVTGYGTTPELQKTLTPGDVQSREISDRAFNQLSTKDRLQLENDAARLNISAQQLFFDTGLQAGGGARLPPPVMPSATTAGAPAIPAAMPAVLAGAQPVVARPAPAMPVAARPAAAAPTAAAAPMAAAPVAPPAAPNAQVVLSPRARQELEKARQLEEFKGMTETQSNAALFGGAMNQAQNVIKQLENEGTVKNAILPSVLQSLVKLVPFGPGEQAANIIESIAKTDPTSLFGPDQNQQRLGQAQIAFATAWLRKTSGAAFGGSEISNTIKEYFPLIGEGDAVIKQKAEARDRAIEGLKLSTGAQGKAYIEKYSGTPTGGASSSNDPFGLRKK